MQCAAMARVVFVKTVKKVRQDINFSRIKTMGNAELGRVMNDEESHKEPLVGGN